MYTIDENWNKAETQQQCVPEQFERAIRDGIIAGIAEKVSKNGYKFAVKDLKQYSADGVPCVTYALQVTGKCPMEYYVSVNDGICKSIGMTAVDVYTKDVIMSDGTDGYEYGLRVYPGQAVTEFVVRLFEDSIRKYMLDRGFIEIVPTNAVVVDDVKVDFSDLKKVLDGIFSKAETKTSGRGKSLMSRLMKGGKNG